MSESSGSPEHPAFDAQAATNQLASMPFGTATPGDVLGAVAELTRRIVPAAEHVSITMLIRTPSRTRPHTAASTGNLPTALDEKQYRHGSGPCIHAAATGTVVRIDDTSHEDTYPEFARQAAAQRVGSTLSLGLPVAGRSDGAINLYAMRPQAFDEDSTRAARTFADYAAVVVHNAVRYAEATLLAEQMHQAIDSRSVIDQAKGILIRDTRCSSEDAFKMLVTASSRSNRKLRDIARSMVEHAQQGG